MMYVGWQAATVQRSILGSLRRLSFPLEMFIRPSSFPNGANLISIPPKLLSG